MSTIPKVVHLYWGRNRPLSRLQLATVASLSSLNKDWTVMVWTPEGPSSNEDWKTGEHTKTRAGRDYFRMLFDLPRVSVSMISSSLLPESPASEVHRSDIWRWSILQQGGVWSDFDIMYVRPLEIAFGDDADIWLCKMYKARKKIKVGNMRVFTRPGIFHLPIGFMAGSGSVECSRFFEEVRRTASLEIDTAEYQSAGRFPLEKCFAAEKGSCLKVGNIASEMVYPVADPNMIISLANDAVASRAMSSCVGVHWFAGSDAGARLMWMSENRADKRKGPLLREADRVLHEILGADAILQ